MLWLLRHAGWFARAAVLPGITAWFFATSAAARAASRDYLSTVLGRPAGAFAVLRHIHSFATTILDRALLLAKTGDDITLDVSGLEVMEAAIAGGRGCVLLGAHLGSFAVLRGLAERCPVPVKMLMFRANAGAFSTAMERLDPAAAGNVIPIGDMHSMLRVHEAVAAGAVVGILADRVPAGGRTVTAAFFGRPARFPTGPFILAASLDVPVLVFHGVRTGHRRYHVAFAPFADRIALPRASRQAALAAVVARYAAWLERSCRAYPYNWFNFFPFWERAAHVPPHTRPLVAAARLPARPVLGTKLDAAAG